MSEAVTVLANDGLIPMDRWGRDHWTTLAYLETRLVDHGPYRIGLDPRMRTKRRHARVFHEAGAYVSGAARTYAVSRGVPVITADSNRTRLNDGTEVRNHDDWDCLQDLAAAGLLTIPPDALGPGVALGLSPLGLRVAAALRQHRAAGAAFATFRWQGEAQP